MNVTYHNKPLEEWPPLFGHNWIIHKAFTKLAQLGFGSPLEEQYVHYGAWFADYPFVGRPETVDDVNTMGCSAADVRPDLFGQTVANTTNWMHNAWINIHYPGQSQDRPNPYLRADLGGEIHVIFEFAGERRDFPLDQFAHYPNNGPICLDGTKGQDRIAVSGLHYDPGWCIKGPFYASVLYDLARRFWPGPYPDPRLDRLVKVAGPGQLSIHMKEDWAVPYVELYAEVTTHLGANPYIPAGTGFPNEDSRPMWPIWVPDVYEPAALQANVAPRSKRTAAIYLGWALHILHDLLHPFHACEKIGSYHLQSENELDNWIMWPEFDHLPVFEGEYKYATDRPVYYPGTPSYSILQPVDMEAKCVYAPDYTRPLYDAVHPEHRQNEAQSHSACEYMLDIAIKETMDLVGNFEFYRQPRVGAPYQLLVEGHPPATSQPSDQFAFALGNRIIVVNTLAGAAYAHTLEGNTVHSPVQLSVEYPVAMAQPSDRFAFALGNRIIVVNTAAGAVFAHTVDGDTIRAPVQLAVEYPVAMAQPDDRFVFAMGNRIMVINTAVGAVFAHVVVGDTVHAPVQLASEYPVARAQPGDQFAFALGRYIIVINTAVGAVFAHKVEYDTVRAPVQLAVTAWPPAGSQPHDRFAFAMGERIVVINTTAGAVFAHEVGL